jgi:hypothetical protein
MSGCVHYWTVHIGYPNPPRRPADVSTELLSKLSRVLADWRKRNRTKLRVARHRLKKRTSDEINKWIKAHSKDLMFAGVSEDDFLRKIFG